MAAGAALGLVVCLFLPWYQETVIARGSAASLNALSTSLTGWGAFSFVEAAVLLVAAAVLLLLFVRAEGAAFHVPGGDGGVITAAGLWTCLLIVWRMFDKQGATGHRLYTTTSGIEWGIFITLGSAALLAYSGSRIKLAHEPEPPLPGERPLPRPDVLAPEPAVAGAAISGSPRSARRMRSPRPAPPRSSRSPEAEPPPRRRIRPVSPAERPTPARAGPEDTAQTQALDRSDEAATQALPGEAATQAMPSEARPRRRGRRPHPGLDFDELQRIDLAEPPEPPTVAQDDSRGEDPTLDASD